MKASMLASRSGGKSAPEEGGFLCMVYIYQECGFLPGVLSVPRTITGQQGSADLSADLGSLFCDSGASWTPAPWTPRLLLWPAGSTKLCRCGPERSSHGIRAGLSMGVGRPGTGSVWLGSLAEPETTE